MNAQKDDRHLTWNSAPRSPLHPSPASLPLYPFLTGVGGISKRGVAHSLVHLAQPLQPGIRRHFDIYRTCVSNCFPTHPATLFTSVDPPSPSQQHWCSCTSNGFKSSLQFLFKKNNPRNLQTFYSAVAVIVHIVHTWCPLGSGTCHKIAQVTNL